MEEYLKNCRADIGSLTLALKAQKALANAAIPSTVVKNDSSFGNRGCSYGLGFSCTQEENLKRVLLHEGIRVKKWIQGTPKS